MDVKKLEATIKRQGKKISKLKADIKDNPLTDNEYKRLIDRLRASEFELNVRIEEYQVEVEELKDEISELLEMLSR